MGLLSIFGFAPPIRCELRPDNPSDCPAPLYGRWRNREVMGDPGLAMGYLCRRCGLDFLPNEVQDRLTRASAEAQAAERAAEEAAGAPSASVNGASEAAGDDASEAEAEAEPDEAS